MKVLRITAFSDFSCPYSYLTESGLRRLSSAEVEIEYRALELFPDPLPLPDPALEPAEWELLQELAAADELELRRVGFRPRTRKAHEAARFAREHGSEPDLRHEIFRAYWADERDIGRIDVLSDLALRVGLEPEEMKIALDIDRYSDEVENDEGLARRLRIPGSPTLFLGTGATARVVAGAQSARQLRDLVHDEIRTRANRPEDG